MILYLWEKNVNFPLNPITFHLGGDFSYEKLQNIRRNGSSTANRH